MDLDAPDAHAKLAGRSGAVSKNKNEGFNSPFAAAKESLAKLVEKPKTPPPPVKKAPPPPPPPKPVSDEELFADAIAGTARIAADPRGRVRAPEPLPPPVSRREADEAEAYATLADLVEGAGPFAMSETD